MLLFQAESQHFSRQRQPSVSQSENQQQAQRSALGGFGLGLPSPVLKTHLSEGSEQCSSHSRSPQAHQSSSGGRLLGGQQVTLANSNDITASNTSYDPIKSLLNQLQQSDQVSLHFISFLTFI